MSNKDTIGYAWKGDDCAAAVQALEQAKNLRILVVGDLMVDAYLLGKVNRISPEAPVPILSASRRERRPGGAANVALNLKALGAAVTVAGVIGADPDGQDLRQAMEDMDMDTAGVLAFDDRRTTVKTRIMGGGQHMLRVDEEDDMDLSADQAQRFLERLAVVMGKQSFDAILIEDYDKGVLSPQVISGLLHMAQEKAIPVSVDPKFRHFQCYTGVALFKPNLKEFREGLGLVWEDGDAEAMERALAKGLSRLMADWHPRCGLVDPVRTRGADQNGIGRCTAARTSQGNPGRIRCRRYGHRGRHGAAGPRNRRGHHGPSGQPRGRARLRETRRRPCGPPRIVG